MNKQNLFLKIKQWEDDFFRTNDVPSLERIKDELISEFQSLNFGHKWRTSSKAIDLREQQLRHYILFIKQGSVDIQIAIDAKTAFAGLIKLLELVAENP